MYIIYCRKILAEHFQFIVEAGSLNKYSKIVHRFHYRGLEHLFDKDVCCDCNENTNFMEHLLQGMRRSKEEKSKLNIRKKKEKKNGYQKER